MINYNWGKVSLIQKPNHQTRSALKCLCKFDIWTKQFRIWDSFKRYAWNIMLIIINWTYKSKGSAVLLVVKAFFTWLSWRKYFVVFWKIYNLFFYVFHLFESVVVSRFSCVYQYIIRMRQLNFNSLSSQLYIIIVSYVCTQP